MTRPNVLLIVADQMRRDALGLNRADFAYTPHLDQLAREGVNFTRAYSSCPSCIAARASLMTGLKHENTGFTGYDAKPLWKYPVTLQQTFANAGYNTMCVGKMHVNPARTTLGYNNVILHDGFLHDKRKRYRNPLEYDDYLPDVRKYLGPDADICDTAPGCNGYATRCWPWDERLHPTAWVVTKSIESLRRRDPTKPFFLKVSFHRPHTPLDPPKSYFDMYDGRPIPDPVVDDWSAFLANTPNPENPIPTEHFFIQRARRAYCSLVTQIDFELNRLLIELGDLNLFDNTLIMLVTDHGDMLYDHNIVRKAMPFEASAGIPMFIRLPKAMQDGHSGITDSRLAELRDVFPTICNACDVPLPEHLDGIDLLNPNSKHEYIHGEHAYGQLSNQWLTDGHEKYCWFSKSGRELLFNLDNDPEECLNLAAKKPERTQFWRSLMIRELTGRPEGYVQDGRLVTTATPRASQPWAGTGQIIEEQP